MITFKNILLEELKPRESRIDSLFRNIAKIPLNLHEYGNYYWNSDFCNNPIEKQMTWINICLRTHGYNVGLPRRTFIENDYFKNVEDAYLYLSGIVLISGFSEFHWCVYLPMKIKKRREWKNNLYNISTLKSEIEKNWTLITLPLLRKIIEPALIEIDESR